MTDDAYIGYEDIGPDGYLRPTRYRIRAMCGRCQHEFSWIAKTPGGPDHPCPRKACKEAALEEEVERRALKLAKMLDEQRAPAQIGNKPVVRAVDTTAQIVMDGYGLTDLKDNIREGETMAPKLPPKQQQAADNFFTSGVPKGINRQVAARMNLRVARALSGSGIRVNPSAVYPGVQPGEKAVRSTGVVPNSGAGHNAR